MSTVFGKIIRREIPADIVYEDDRVIVFKDINPRARVHLLLVPKKEIISLFELTPEDKELMGHMMLLLPQLAKAPAASAADEVAMNVRRLIFMTRHINHKYGVLPT